MCQSLEVSITFQHNISTQAKGKYQERTCQNCVLELGSSYGSIDAVWHRQDISLGSCEGCLQEGLEESVCQGQRVQSAKFLFFH